ncbi:hypothetical protein D5086_026827 [Populus alba]|uniref:Uncharacterized protein n=1 Tax=Populus alba TaxID=43335 RepID=A0ACC4B2Y4_POPAL
MWPCDSSSQPLQLQLRGRLLSPNGEPAVDLSVETYLVSVLPIEMSVNLYTLWKYTAMHVHDLWEYLWVLP